MKRFKKRWLSIILCVAMLVGALPAYALAADNTSANQIGNYYEADDETGALASSPNLTGDTTKSYADGMVLTNKTIEAGEEENEFQITLDVRTTSDIENIVYSEDAAVVIVLDLSGSMSGTRLASAKQAAKAFVESFANTEDADAVRKVAVVGFSGNTTRNSRDAAITYQSWTDASDNSISAAINGLTATGGTCLQAGLILAKNLLNSSEVADITNKNIVVLTDGEPTFYLNSAAQSSTSTTSVGSWNQVLGDGSSTSHDTHTQTESTAASIIASGINVYSVYFGNDTVNCTGMGSCNLNKSGARWLRENCGFITYSTENAGELAEIFQTISELIQVQASAWIASDPMGEMFEFAGFSEDPDDENEYYYDDTSESITWNLRLSDPVDEEDGYYVYQLTYTVKLNTLASGYSAGTYYQTNGVTSVTYFVEQASSTGASEISYGTAYFNVPSAKGYAADLTFNKVDVLDSALPGAAFTLTTADDPNWSMTAVSDANGVVAFEDIPSGHTYTLAETNAPSGYIPSDETYTITVSYGEVSGDIGTDNTVVNIPESKYEVTYEYVSGTAGMELPDAISTASGDYAVSDDNTYYAGETVYISEDAPEVGTIYTVTDGSAIVGTWTLTEWEPEDSTTMTEDGVTFVGTWVYEEAPKYGVTYEYVSGTDGMDLPDAISTASGDYAVSDDDTYYVGETVNISSEAPSVGTTYTVTEGNAIVGSWTLVSWSPDSSTAMTEDGVTFVGTWVYTEGEKYKVTYQYVSGTEGMALPNVISTTEGDFAVSDDDAYYVGAIVSISSDAPSVGTTYEVIEDSVVVGTWMLTEWNPEDSATMTEDGVTFVGTWVYEEAPKYGVTYEYVSGTDGMDLPGAISTASGDYAVSDDGTYYAGETVSISSDAPEVGTTYEVIEDSVVVGTWTLVDWDPEDSATMTENGITFVGTWVYEESQKYDVVYEYVSGTEGMDLPDAISTESGDYAVGDDGTYYAGETVSISSDAPEVGTTYEVIEDSVVVGTWTLTEWNPDGSTTMTEDGVIFIGTWVYEESQKYEVAYEYVSGTEGMVLPDEISTTDGDYAVSDDDTYYAGETVYISSDAPSVDTTYEVTIDDSVVIGTWTLTEWNPEDSATMTEEGITFIGTWVYEESQKYEVVYEYVSGTEGMELPDAISTTDGDYAVSDDDTYYAGETVYISSDAPSVGTTYEVTEDSVVVGTWTLTEWNPDGSTIMTEDGVIFIGTWVYTENDVETPDDPDVETPDNPDVETPDDPDAETPDDPDVETPDDTDVETPDDTDSGTTSDDDNTATGVVSGTNIPDTGRESAYVCYTLAVICALAFLVVVLIRAKKKAARNSR